MARIRTVKPEYWGDETVGTLSLPARLMFPASWNFADDEGLVNWSATFLKASIFPYDQHVSVEDVAGWMKEIEDAEFVYVYTTSRAKHRVAFVINFREHQRIDKPQAAKLPVPNWRDPSVVMVYARRDDFLCAHCAEPVNEQFAADTSGRRYDPICQRIKLASERKGAPDDPTNIQVVHVMCAKDFDPDAPLKPIPGTFRESSGNGPGSVQERSSVPVSPVSPLPQALADPVTQSDKRSEETAGQDIPGTFQERSREEGKGREGIRKGKENPSGADDGLFPLDPIVPKQRAGKPRESGGQPTAQTFIGEWLEGCSADAMPTQDIIGRVGKELKVLLANKAHPDDIRQGLADWEAKGGGSPKALAAFVNGARGRRRQAPAHPGIDPSRMPTADQRFFGALAAAENLARSRGELPPIGAPAPGAVASVTYLPTSRGFAS